jgi:parallel beta-helix repeat protein
MSAETETATLLVAPGQPGAYPTIGAALAAAPAGGVVSVTPGIYHEVLSVVDRAVTIVAAQGPGTVTIDAGAGAYAAISCGRGRLELRDLTLKGGDAPAVGAEQAQLTITGCALSSRSSAAVAVKDKTRFALSRCVATGGRFGFLAEGSEGTIDGCEFADVTEDGIIVRSGSAVTIRSCVVTRCGDSGILVYGRAVPTLEECEISHTGGPGVAVAEEGVPVLRRCRILDTAGPGVSFADGCAGTVEDCVTERTGTPAVEVAPGATVLRSRVRRPPAIVAAVLLMAPVAVTWLVAGIAWMVVTSRLEGDALFLFWILAVFILLLCLLVTLMAVVAMATAWYGVTNAMNLPAGFTLAVFVLALVNLLVQHKIEYNPTMLTPLIVGSLAAVAAALARSAPAKKWFATAATAKAISRRRAGR